MENEHRIYSDLVTEAAVALGGVAALASRLNVPPTRVQSWIAAQAVPPREAFLEVLEILGECQ